MAAWLKGVQLLLQSHDGNGEDLYLLLQGDDSTASFQLVLVNTQQLQQLIPPLHDRLLLHPVPLLLELTLMAFKSLNLSCLERMSVEMASCFLTTGPYMLQVRPISWIRLNSDHLIEVALPQQRLPLNLARQLLQLLLPQQVLLQSQLSKVLLLLKLHQSLINIM